MKADNCRNDVSDASLKHILEHRSVAFRARTIIDEDILRDHNWTGAAKGGSLAHVPALLRTDAIQWEVNIYRSINRVIQAKRGSHHTC